MHDLTLCKKYISLAESAKSRGIEFTLTLNDYKTLLRRKTCPYSGVTLINHGADNNTSIDRIDNSKGYIKGNVIACEIMANRVKNNMSVEMILNMSKVIKKYLDRD